ncbi:MAG: VanZ family protein [Eubacteriaceae bacterium]
MINKILLKKTLAIILYIAGLLFSLYIANLMLNPYTCFDIEGLLVSTLFFCVPTGFATFLLISITQDEQKKYKLIKILIYMLFFFYILLLLSILFFRGMRVYNFSNRNSFNLHIQLNANFVPFKTIFNYIYYFLNDTINKNIIIENLLGNLLLFAPMGIFLPCLFSRLKSYKKFIITLLIILVGVETAQLITYSGSFDIDDIILNLTGAVCFLKFWNLKFVQQFLVKIYVIK